MWTKNKRASLTTLQRLSHTPLQWPTNSVTWEEFWMKNRMRYSVLWIHRPLHRHISQGEINDTRFLHLSILMQTLKSLTWEICSLWLARCMHVFRGSLVAQMVKNLSAMQDTWVWSLVQEDPTYRGATKPTCHNYWAYMPQLLSPHTLECMPHDKSSHHK